MAEEESKDVDAANAAYEDARKFICKEPASGEPSLHAHLTQVLLRLLVERPSDANTAFETLSLALRKVPPPPVDEEAVAAAEAAAAAAAAAAEAEAAEAAAAEEAARAAAEEAGEEYVPPVKKKVKPPPFVPSTPEEFQMVAIEKWCALHAQYLLPPKPKPEPVEGEEPEPEEEEEAGEPEEEDPGTAGQVTPILDDAVLWSWAGVGFGEEQTYRLFRSLQCLAGREGEECKVRFWGKILGKNADYFVAEALTETTSAPDPLEVNDETEEKVHFALPGEKDYDCEGLEGPNKYTYWVSSDPAQHKASWTKLPHVTPAQIVANRASASRFFTGDLTSPANCFPPLPGNTEAHRLRACIAEITADTVLTLSGIGVEADEDALVEDPPQFKTKPCEEDEEAPKQLAVAELRLPETWVHAEVDLRPSGRCQVKPAPEDDEGGGDESDLAAKRDAFFAKWSAKDAPPDADPSLSRGLCRPISEDADASTGGRATWVVRGCAQGAAATPSANGVCFAKSLKWPGATCVAGGFHAPLTAAEQPRRRITNVYVGYGVPRQVSAKSVPTFTPRAPMPLPSEAPMMPDEQEDVVVEPPKPAEDEE